MKKNLTKSYITDTAFNYNILVLSKISFVTMTYTNHDVLQNNDNMFFKFVQCQPQLVLDDKRFGPCAFSHL